MSVYKYKKWFLLKTVLPKECKQISFIEFNFHLNSYTNNLLISYFQNYINFSSSTIHNRKITMTTTMTMTMTIIIRKMWQVQH